MRTSSATTIQTKEIFESLVTSSLSPEEILARLNSYGIEWYLTEKGDLMIRYWQVGARDFLPAEHVSRIRESQTVPREANMLEWLSRNLRDLETTHAGQWIAVADNQVKAAADSLPSLLELVRDLRVENPFITQIPAGPVVWATAYARHNI